MAGTIAAICIAASAAGKSITTVIGVAAPDGIVLISEIGALAWEIAMIVPASVALATAVPVVTTALVTAAPAVTSSLTSLP